MSSEKREQELEDLYKLISELMQKNAQEAEKRMTKIEESHLAATKRMEKIESVLEVNTASIKELNLAVSNMFNIVNLSQQNFEVIQRNFEVIVTQIKGIQVESRHVIDHLFGIQE